MSCRQPRRNPETWTELVDSGMDEYEIAIALLNAAKEHIEDQERELAELRQQLAARGRAIEAALDGVI